MFFRSHTEVQQNFEKVLDVNGGAIPMYYYGHFDFKDRNEAFDDINDALIRYEESPYVSKVFNPLSFVDTNQMDLSKLSKVKDFIRIVDTDFYFRFMVFPRDLDNETVTGVTSIDSGNGSIIGSQLLMRELNNVLIKGQILSIIVTFIVILLMLLISLRDLKLAIVSSIPVLLSSIVLYGFLGVSGISLNLMTSTIFSITLGIGVDYAIHYSSVYQYYKKHGDRNPRETALRYTARPVIANALGLSLGLSALWLSPLLIHIQISALMWVAMIFAVFTSLTLLPTLIKK
jgi:hypothetical protein